MIIIKAKNAQFFEKWSENDFQTIPTKEFPVLTHSDRKVLIGSQSLDPWNIMITYFSFIRLPDQKIREHALSEQDGLNHSIGLNLYQSRIKLSSYLEIVNLAGYLK
jgi:hypothetical protein